MTVAIGYADLLAEELALDDDRIRHAVEELSESTREVAELSQQAREVERVLQGVGTPPVDVSSVAADVVSEIRSRYEDVDVAERFVPDLLAAADEGIALAVGNLVENSIEHGGHDPRIVVETFRADDSVAVRVADDGPGIPDHERAVICDDHGESQLDHGSGLGLWLVKWTAEAFGGEVTFGESDLGGAAVTLWLPRAE